jgi:micrococcal nuclease
VVVQRLRPWWRSSFLTAFAATVASGCFMSAVHAECTGDDGGSSLVADIRGGDTLILEDGRSARLAGVLLPRRSSDGGVTAEARTIAEKAVADLVAGQKVELRLDSGHRDRYGRLLAQVFVTKDGQRVWLQERLIASGLARVISSKDNRLCVPELLGIEKTARETNQGQWRTGLFSVKPAASEDMLQGLAQSYEIVEGRIENVAEVRGRTYLNFGKNWRRDFTVTVPSDAARLFAGQTDLAGLKGRLVRVRGWIEDINGPSISLTHPEQLEILESGTLSQRSAP